MLRRIKQILYRGIDNREISYKRLCEIVKISKNVILLDVRSRQEYMERHLDNAINIPLFDLEKLAEQKLKNKSQTIIIYCTTGSRSKRAKEILELLGYEEVYNLKNGLDGI